MDFELDDGQRALLATVRDLCGREVRPNAQAWDAAERLPPALLAQLGALGLLGMGVPEEQGGAGLDLVTRALVVEELARWDGSLARVVAAHDAGASCLVRLGEEPQLRRWLPEVASGARLATACLAGPEAGCAWTGVVATAEEGGFRLRGEARFVPLGSIADRLVILARTDPQPGGAASLFLVERPSPGLGSVPLRGRLGLRASGAADLRFDDLPVPFVHRLGAADADRRGLAELLDQSRVLAGALAVGLARGALEEAAAYARERRAFGRPIVELPALRWKLADASTELEAARLLVLRAAALCDAGRPCSAEAAMAKLFASEAACRAAASGVQIHGGNGFTRDYPIERIYRDARVCAVGDGSSDLQRARIAGEVLA